METFYFVLVNGQVVQFYGTNEPQAFKEAYANFPHVVLSSGYADLVIAKELARGVREEKFID